MLHTLAPAAHAQIHPEDADRYGIVSSAPVVVQSSSGKLELTAQVTADVSVGTVFIPALESELLLMVEITAQVLFFTSHRGDRILSRPEGSAVAMALAPPKLPCHGNRGFPREGADDFGHCIASFPGLPDVTTRNLQAKP